MFPGTWEVAAIQREMSSGEDGSLTDSKDLVEDTQCTHTLNAESWLCWLVAEPL